MEWMCIGMNYVSVLFFILGSEAGFALNLQLDRSAKLAGQEVPEVLPVSALLSLRI